MRVWDNYKAQLNLNKLESYVFAENRAGWVAENTDNDSEDFWYFKLLDLQSRLGGEKNSAELEEALGQVKSSEVIDSERIQRLLFRQAVTDFNNDTAADVSNWIQDVTEPKLDYEQEAENVPKPQTEYKSTLQLDTKAIQTELYNNLSGADLRDVFTSESAKFLAERKLSATQIEQYLELIADEAPDVPFILTLIKKDLQTNAFGSRRIHVKLSREQLATLADKSDNLWQDDKFLAVYGWKLRAVSDADLRFDLNARLKYFTALKDFAISKIPNNVNASLKALILYNYLTLQEKLGYYDTDVLRQYLAIPKAKFVRYAPEGGKKKKKGRNNPARYANFDTVVGEIPELAAIGDDMDFVTRACHDMFLNGEKPSNWRSTLDESFAQPIFAEEMLCAGRGSSSTIPGVKKFQESQQDVLRRFKGAAYFEKTLRPRVDLRLTPDNKAVYSVDDTVNLKMFVKNVPQLTYEVYEINERSWFITKGIEVPADIGIDGANPFVVKSMDFSEPALMKKTRIVEIPELRGKRGGFVVDIKGGGMECRAVIKKGEYRYVAEQSPEGFVFKIVNELNEEVPSGRIQMDGVDYYADGAGEIVLPFQEAEDRISKVVVDDHTTSGGAASLHFFEQTARHYELDFGIYIDRENILEKREASIIIRPNLYLNQETVSAQENLRDNQLTITTTNELGEEVSRVVPIEVRDDQETVQSFIVPTECRAVTVVYKGFLKSTGQEFNNFQKFEVNMVDDDRVIADIFLFPYGRAGYVLACQGKNGEPFPNRVIDLEINHRMTNDPLQFTLETDANGRVYLGRLPDVIGLKASTRDAIINKEESFNLLEDMVNVPRVVNAHKDSVIRIPYPSVKKGGPGVQIYDTAFIKSFSGNCEYKKGYIEIAGLNTGDYVVFIRDQISADVLVNVTDGPVVSNRFGNYALGTSRYLQLSEEFPLQITNVKGSREKGYTIKLQGYNDKTRVHVVASSFVPSFSAFSFLASPTVDPDVLDFPDYELSEYLPQKELKAEYTYIQERRDAPKIVGNLLPKPGLLINRVDENKTDRPAKADKVAPTDPGMQLKINKRYGKKQRKDNVSTAGRANSDRSNLEFLLEPSRVYANVPVAEDGTVVVQMDQISDQSNLLQIIAADDDNTAIRNVILEESREPQAFKDVRLSDAGLLDPSKLFVEKRQVLPLQPGETYTVDDVRYADFESYFDLSQVIELYRALGADKDPRAADVMAAFRFVGNWDQYTMEEKLAKYGGFACNELNYFLYNKDPEFFGEVVKPLIQSKMQKTFFDLYLLEDISITEYVHKSDKYFSLNAFERIILAKRVSSQVGLTRATLKTFKEAAGLQVVLPQETDRQFNLAIANSLLSGDLCDAWIKANPKPTILQADGTILDTADDEDNDSVINEKIEIVNSDTPITKSKENQEQTYFGVPWSAANSDLIKPSRFWNDYARFALGQSGQDAFISKYFTEATNSVNEMLLALAVLDIPCTAPAPKKTFSADLKAATITATNATILFAKEIKEGQYTSSQLSLNTNFYDPNDPTEVFDGETVDKFLTGREFQTSRIYGLRVVVTNVSSVSQSFELLVQIPEGSIGTTGGFTTKNIPVKLDKFGTFRLEYEFYFPQPGEFKKAPVMMTKNGHVVGKGLEACDLKVDVVPPPVDRSSWTYLSQQADSEELLTYLSESVDIYKVDLTRICWRLDDAAFYKKVTDILRKRQCYNESIWAYGLKAPTGANQELGEYLAQNEQFQEAVKPYFISDIVKYDPIDGLDFQFLEFSPIVKQRYHKMSIETDGFLRQYNEFLLKAAYSSTNVDDLSTEDKMILTAYLIMQDRAVDAVSIFTKITEEEAYLVSDLAYDFQKAYLSFFDADTPGDDAFDVYEKYKISTLPASKMALLEKMRVALVEMGDPNRADDDFDAIALASKKDAVKEKLDFEKNDDSSITFSYSNLTKMTLNFYILNVEVNFSEQPFEVLANGFTLITPNESVDIDVPAVPPGQSGSYTYTLPQLLVNNQFVCEAKSGGVTVAKQCYDNELLVQTAPKLGEIRVLDRETNQPMEQVYCKIFGKRKDNGDAIFFKDGYTDCRGRFNYSRRSDDQLAHMTELVGLAYTDSFGALIFSVPFPEK